MIERVDNRPSLVPPFLIVKRIIRPCSNDSNFKSPSKKIQSHDFYDW